MILYPCPGSIELCRKASDDVISDLRNMSLNASQQTFNPSSSTSSLGSVMMYPASTPSLVYRYRKWERLHKLGIISLSLIPEQGFLVSVGYDGVCKARNPFFSFIIHNEIYYF